MSLDPEDHAGLPLRAERQVPPRAEQSAGSVPAAAVAECLAELHRARRHGRPSDLAEAAAALVAVLAPPRSAVRVHLGDPERPDTVAGRGAAQAARSTLEVPLVAGMGRHVGLLSLTHIDRDAFGPQVAGAMEQVAEVLAGYVQDQQELATVQELNGQLQQAMRTRPVIDQAKGVLIATHGYDADEAFEELRRVSRNAQVKVHEVAKAVLRDGRLPDLPHAGPARSRRDSDARRAGPR